MSSTYFSSKKASKCLFPTSSAWITINNFFISFSTSCEILASCCEYVSLCQFFYCTNVWYSLSEIYLLRYWAGNLIEWYWMNTPELHAPYPLLIKSFAVLFCWYLLWTSIVDVIKINFSYCKYNSYHCWHILQILYGHLRFSNSYWYSILLDLFESFQFQYLFD